MQQQARPLILKGIFLLLTLLIMIVNFHATENFKSNITTDRGLLDLSRYNFETRGRLFLDQEWQFFYDRFLKPVPYRELDTSVKPDAYIAPPTVWNEYKADGKPIPGFGSGTYRMIVTGVTPGIPLAIRILPQSTAFDLYVDDVLLAENGKVSQNREDSRAAYHPDTVQFTPQSGQFVITVHISNYIYARGGMWDAPTLGTKDQIGAMDRFILYRDLFLMGCYTIMFLMFLVVYINRLQNRSRLYFAVLCVIISARVLIYGAHLITEFTENFRLITFLEYGTRLWFPVFILLLVNRELSGRIPKRFLEGLTLSVSAVTAAVAVLPIHVFTAFTKVLMAYDLLIGLGLCIILLWPGERFFRKNKNKVFFVYGILAIFISAVYDILFASTASVEMTPIGFFVALLAFAFVLAITYSDALTDSERALRELELEGERKLQTELKLLQSQIRPHFIYNALSAIANVCRKDGRQAEQLILDLAYFMQASFDFSSADRLTTLENELEYIRKYVHIEKARFGDKISYHEQIEVPLDVQIPRLIIEPLVENAIRHGISKKKGGGQVKLKVVQSPGGIMIEVSDSGAGMTEEKLKDVFHGESRGVGLKNIQDRLVRLGGTGLNVESVLNEYTKISFTIKEEA